MGMFYIYSYKKSYELYDMIDYKKAYIGWEQKEYEPYVETQVVKEELVMLDNIYDYILCAEILPHNVVLYYGDRFEKQIELPYDVGMDWLFIHGYNRVSNYILKECYACADYALAGVDKFCKAVAHNKAEQSLLEGHE